MAETGTNELTPYEVALARAYPHVSGFRVEGNGLGFVDAEWLRRYRSGEIRECRGKIRTSTGWEEVSPVCTADDLEDIGGGITIQRRYLDGKLAGVAWWHPGCGEDWIPIDTPLGWKLVTEHPLTLSPSVRCRACGFHGWIRDGKWVPA